MISLTSTVRTLLAAAAAVLLLAAPARAASTQLVFFEAPGNLTAASSTDASRAAAFADFETLGVTALRINLRWSDVALSSELPTKPAADMSDPANYYWAPYSTVIDTAKSKGMTVLISLSGPVPKWATAAKADNLTRPDATEFRAFAAAAAKRFGSGKVLWSIWNEPNLSRFLLPQVSGGRPVSPAIYRALFIAGQAGIKTDAGLSGAKVLFGETAPVGGASTAARLYPLAFLRQALCLTTRFKLDRRCGSRLAIDGLAHHPYQFTDGALKSQDVTYRNLSRLVSFIDRAAKGGAVPSKLPIYLTEFGIQSFPDRTLGLNPQAQLEVRARAERAAYYNRRVRGFSQYLLTDDAAIEGFQTGLRYATGAPKPAFEAFRLTLDARPVGNGKRPKTSLWGLVRVPAGAGATITLEVAAGKRGFTAVKTLKANRLGAFTVTDRYRAGARYRYRVATPQGTLISPPVRPFAGWTPPGARK